MATADLTTMQKATLNVALDDGAGTVTDLGVDWQFSIAGTAATVSVVDGQAYIVAQQEGTATITISHAGLTATVVATITASAEGAVLVITIGEPEPK